MARKKFNLDTLDLDGYTVLWHGDRAAGKTHLIGDALHEESKVGPVRYINVSGEDGQLTLKGGGLGDVGETCESVADLWDFIKEYAGKLQALGVDSLNATNYWVGQKVAGASGMPKDGGQWSEMHREMYNLMLGFRRCAKFFFATCPSDKSVNQITGLTMITPDLPGREAAGSAGWFDFVGYISATPTGPGKIKRTFNMIPNSQIIVRQRLPHQIADLIELPDGPGGWLKIKSRIAAAVTGGK